VQPTQSGKQWESQWERQWVRVMEPATLLGIRSACLKALKWWDIQLENWKGKARSLAFACLMERAMATVKGPPFQWVQENLLGDNLADDQL
jgi:hypothetical protein